MISPLIKQLCSLISKSHVLTYFVFQMETCSKKGYIKLSKTPFGIMDYTADIDRHCFL